MKKKLFTILGILTFMVMLNSVGAEPTTSQGLAGAIKLYKAGNYSECYVQLNTVLKNEPANAIAYYYMAMTATQLGKRDEAIDNYNKAIALSPENNNLNKYAQKGKRCLETPNKCADTLYETVEEEFIRNQRGPRYTEEVRSDFERLKIENLMREINRSGEIDPNKFKEYKDFSSMNTDSIPSNDEIVAAMRVLQKAGLNTGFGNNYSDLSILTGSIGQDSIYNIMNNHSNLSPQVIQTLLTNNMTQGL